LFNQLLVSSSPPAAFVRTDNSGRPIPWCDALTLCLSSPTALTLQQRSPASRRLTGFVCACTHYLVFKEPTVCAPVAPSPCVTALSDRTRSG